MVHELPVPIDWMRLARTVEHYKDLGFQYVEASWVVPGWASNVTHPERTGIFPITIGDLVGSAEQSFIALAGEVGVPPGRYVALTPCFRNEARLDKIRHNWFMKVELWDSTSPDQTSLANLVNQCAMWFERLADHRFQVTVEQTGEGLDLMMNGIEIGSYGVRTASVQGQELSWVYGTGLAEPRFSQAIAQVVQDLHLTWP